MLSKNFRYQIFIPKNYFFNNLYLSGTALDSGYFYKIRDASEVLQILTANRLLCIWRANIINYIIG